MGRFTGRGAVLIGLARTHIALARYLVGEGARVRITDLKPAEQLTDELAQLADLADRIEFRLGGHTLDDVLDADIVFVTPGARRDVGIVRQAIEAGRPVSSEIELLFELCPAPIVGITGSSGKTTTTTLTGLILERTGRRVWVGGNIGRPLITHVAEMTPDDLVVLELSSFQLEPMVASPAIAAITNITPNHLDRHPSMEAYAAAKANILRYQRPDDRAVLNADDPVGSAQAPLTPARLAWFSRRRAVARGAFLQTEAGAGGVLTLRDDDQTTPICSTAELKLPGVHNWENALAAAAIAAAAGATAEHARPVLTSFTGVPHRLELVRTRRGVAWYNDSIATAPERTLAALRSFDRPVVLMLGGRDKHLPLEELAAEVVRRGRAAVLFGEAAPLLEVALRAADPGGRLVRRRVERLPEAVAAAAELARPGDVVLLSPACTSYDQYNDFEERGAHFQRLVAELGE